jgi:hypothetical protein
MRPYRPLVSVKPTNRIWRCPRCPDGTANIRAPQRLQLTDTRLYCLPCSEATGRLVKRYCPSLEGERAAKAGRAEAQRRKKAERERQAALDARSIGGVDIQAEFARLCRLPSFKTGRLAKHPPPVRMRRISKPQTRAVGWSGESPVIAVWPSRSAEHVACWLLWGAASLFRYQTGSRRTMLGLVTCAADEAWPGLGAEGSDDAEYVQSLVVKLTASGLLTAPAAP